MVLQKKKIVFRMGGYDFKTPVERVLELLGTMKHRLPEEESEMQAELAYSIYMISTNKLYDTVFGKSGEVPDELRDLLANYGGVAIGEDEELASRRGSVIEEGGPKYDSKMTLVRAGSFGGFKFPSEVLAIMENVRELDFDIFGLEERTEGDALVTMGNFLMERMGLFQELHINHHLCSKLFRRIQEGYQDNPYHCKTHAADVTQVQYLYIYY